MAGSYSLIIGPVIWLILISIFAGFLGQAAWDNDSSAQVDTLTSELSQLNASSDIDAGSISFWKGITFTFGDIFPWWLTLIFTVIPGLIFGIGIFYALKPGGS